MGSKSTSLLLLHLSLPLVCLEHNVYTPMHALVLDTYSRVECYNACMKMLTGVGVVAEAGDNLRASADAQSVVLSPVKVPQSEREPRS